MPEHGFKTESVRLACIWTWLPGQPKGFCTWVRREKGGEALGFAVPSKEEPETQIRH
ncbi:hypothetical protein KXS07_36465 [Inquilinus limosus]|uniref:hypothetical protein n=1 Tax=Inquilinus limosus TaxID=171674 RepID=UPI003F13DFC8